MSQTEVQLIKNGAVVDADINGMSSSKLSGALPAISGASLTNLPTPTGKVKNLLINGEALVHQRGDASVAVSDGNYLVDRFRFANNGTLTGTGAQDSTVPDIANSSYFARSMKVTSTGTTASSSAGDYAAITTRLERNDVANLGWGTSNAQTVTLSFYVRSSKTGIFSAYLIGGDGFNRTFTFEYTIASANTWQKVEKTISGDTGGTWTYSSDNTIGLGVSFVLENLGSGAGTTSTLNSWQAGNNYAGSTNQVNLFDTNGATFYITGIQLEVGSVATDFEHRSFAQELQLCQRYFCRLSTRTDDNSILGQGMYYSDTQIRLPVRSFTEMRTHPTVETTDSTSHFTAYAKGVGTDFATFDSSHQECPSGIVLGATMPDNSYIGAAAYIVSKYNASTGVGVVSLNAEL